MKDALPKLKSPLPVKLLARQISAMPIKERRVADRTAKAEFTGVGIGTGASSGSTLSGLRHMATRLVS